MRRLSRLVSGGLILPATLMCHMAAAWALVPKFGYGWVRRWNGTIVAGPQTPAWKGRCKLQCRDRRWVTVRSPERIANCLKVDWVCCTIGDVPGPRTVGLLPRQGGACDWTTQG